MRKLIILPLILAAFILSACGILGINTVRCSGDPVEESRRVSEFSSIRNETNFDIHLSQGENYSFTIEADKNIMESVQTEVTNGKLVIKTEVNTLLVDCSPSIIYITMPEIEVYQLAGSGNLFLDTDIESNDLEIQISGSGDLSAGKIEADSTSIKIFGSGNISSDAIITDEVSINITGSGDLEISNLVTEELDAVVNGSGNFNLEGSTNEAKISLGGSGEYYGRYFETGTASVKVYGSGNVTLWVNNSLDFSIFGSGDISYYGTPRIISSQIAGSGNLIQISE